MKFKEKFLLLMMKIFRVEPQTLGVPVIIIEKGKILLGKRSPKDVLYPNLWGLPGGLVETREKIEEAGKREVKEELGVNIRVIKKSNKVYEEFISYKRLNFRAINIPIYGKIIKGGPTPKDETSEVKWFTPTEVRKMKLAYNHKEILKEEGVI
ncbi:ADP-ribose pyrophosphatase [uncultured archaeon]|nr:ADP-ribose pyrophosphatase [uncultured archaeon]